MTVEIPEELGAALKAAAMVQGKSPDGYVCEVLERTLGQGIEPGDDRPFETGFGMLAKYGPAPTEEEIDANRAEMFRNFGESFD